MSRGCLAAVWLSNDLAAQMLAFTQSRGLSKSDVLRLSLYDYFKKNAEDKKVVSHA